MLDQIMVSASSSSPGAWLGNQGVADTAPTKSHVLSYIFQVPLQFRCGPVASSDQ